MHRSSTQPSGWDSASVRKDTQGVSRGARVARVELHVYPPYSYKMSAKHVGALVLEQETGQGETLGELLARLESSDPEAWRGIFDARTGQMQPSVLTIVNNAHLPRSVAPQTALSDGDKIAIRMAYSGG